MVVLGGVAVSYERGTPVDQELTRVSWRLTRLGKRRRAAHTQATEVPRP